MALDEFLFGRISRYFRSKKQEDILLQSHCLHLHEIKRKLSIVATAVSGQPVEIFEAEREGGCKNNVYFLPASMAIFPGRSYNLSFYFFRVLFMSVQQEIHSSFPASSSTADKSESEGTFPENILSRLYILFPEVKTIHDRLYTFLTSAGGDQGSEDLSWLYGKPVYASTPEEDLNSLQHLPEKIRHSSQPLPQTTIRSKAVEEIKSISIDKKAQEDYVLTHNFEKVDTADEFNGTWRDFDGEDELESHQEALDELQLKFTVRVDDPVHSVYQAEYLENTNVSESGNRERKEPCYLYDEWDYKQRSYKTGYCKVYPAILPVEEPVYYRQTLSEYHILLNGLRKMLATIHNKMQHQRRQVQGNEFDMDALTDRLADVKSGHTPSEKIYIASHKKEKDISLLLLLDTSLSSDGYANGNRIIDVEKKISLLFGEILNEYHIDFCISAFHSNTRNHSDYHLIKGFDDSWEKARNRLGALEPAGYTRIGASIRHSAALMEQRPAKNKWLLLLSDGKPNDYDRYEGRYGEEDIRQALRELNSRQINSYALAITSNAKHYLPRMFGENHYQILSSPEELLTSMVKLFERIRHNR